MERRRKSGAWAGCALGLSCSLGTTAASGADEAPGHRVIEEVVVTAQKIEENLQDVPFSVSTIDGEFLREAAITDLGDGLRYLPSVQYRESNAQFATFSIRGLSTPPIAIGLEPSVGLVIDEVPYGRSTYAQDAVFDLERLEVLRGPQGTLFGKNTIAGVVNFVTAEPSFEPEGRFLLAAGSQNALRAEGGVSFPVLEDVLAARLAFRLHRREMGIFNTTRDETNDIEEIAGRLKLLWRASDRLELGLVAWASDLDAHGTPGQIREATPRSLEVFREFDARAEADEFDGRTQIDSKTSSARQATSISAKAAYDLGPLGPLSNVELAAVGGWSGISTPFELDGDYSPIHVTRFGSGGPDRYEQTSLELRATGTAPAPFGWGRGVDFVGGLYGQHVEATSRLLFDIDLNGLLPYVAAGTEAGPNNVGYVTAVPDEVIDALDALVGSNSFPDVLTGPAGGLVTLRPLPEELATEQFVSDTTRSAISAAAFLQGTWHLTERWDVTLGARLGFEEREADIYSLVTRGPGVSALLAGQRDFAASLTGNETDFSPRAALAWRWTDDVLFFASASRGFKAGGFANAPFNPDNLRYDSEKATSFEAGVKSRLFSGSLLVNAAAFHAELFDLQVRNFTGVTFTTENAEKATSTGFELDLRWLPPVDGLTVSGSLGWIDAGYDRFPNGTAIVGSREDVQDLGGRRLPYTPELTAALHPTIVFPLRRAWGLGGIFGLDFLYRGSQFLDSDLDPESFQEATARLNARLGAVTAGERWSLFLNAQPDGREGEPPRHRPAPAPAELRLVPADRRADVLDRPRLPVLIARESRGRVPSATRRRLASSKG